VHDRATTAPVEDIQRRSFPDRVAVPDVQSIHPTGCHVDQQLRIIRIHSNLSRIALGRKVGLSYRQIQKYKSGKNLMSASVRYKGANRLNVPIARFFEALPEAELTSSDGSLPEIGERIAYLATSEGRSFVEEILGLPPPLRTRTLALIKLAAGDNDEATKLRDLADTQAID